MKIVDNRIGKMNFNNLKNGDTFLLKGRLCMKVSTAYPTKDTWNVYDFEQRSLIRVENVEEEVKPVNTELHIVD